MSKSTMCLAAAAAVAMIGSAAIAAEQNAGSQDAASMTPAQQKAEQDFGRVSKDGFKAMNDVTMARWAIFDGKTTEAKKDIADASSALQKAQNDDTVFIKAEDQLTPPPGVKQPNNDGKAPGSTAVKWIPVNGAISLGEDYVETPEKSKGVAKANAQLQQGDHKGAMDSLRLAGVTVSFDEEVAPLGKTLTGVSKAEELLDSGNFYEANQQLKGVQDAVRFDVVDMSGAPGKHAANAQNSHMASNDKK
jgi:hypothetical protein